MFEYSDSDPAIGGEEALLGEQRVAQLQHSQAQEASGNEKVQTEWVTFLCLRSRSIVL